MDDKQEHMPSEGRLRELLVGRKVVGTRVAKGPYDSWGGNEVPMGFLDLDDGTVLKVWGHLGGCICGAGDYYLSALNGCDNIITNVKVENEPRGDYYEGLGGVCRTCGETNCYATDHDHAGRYRIYVLAGDERVNLAEFVGSDGNGYYGTGWWLEVQAT